MSSPGFLSSAGRGAARIQVFVCAREDAPVLSPIETFLYRFGHDGQICLSFCRLPSVGPGQGRRISLALIVYLLIAPAAADPATVQQAAGRVLLAAVSDRNNRPTVDVGPDDFVVEEGNDEREVLAVRVADYPVAVLIDNGSDSAAVIAELRRAAARFVTRIGQRPVIVATLAEPGEIVADFDADRQRVLDQIERVAPSASPRLAPLAAVTKVAAMISAFETPFSVAVVISVRPIDTTEPTLSDRLTPILDSGAAVHVVALRAASGSAADGIATPDLLRQIADQTRGQYITIYTPASLPIALDGLADRLASEIMIDYLVPADTAARDVRVGIRIPGARVRGLGVSK